MSDTPTHFERLRHNVLIETLSDAVFASCRGEFHEHRYAAGEIILEDASEGDELHCIVEGRVRISKGVGEGRDTILALLHAGDFFGELELIDGRQRAARVTAVDPCVTFAIRREAFERLLNANPALAMRLLQVLSIRLRTVDHHFVREIERLQDNAGRELRTLRRVIEAAKVLNSTLDLDKLLGVILETALGLVDGDRGTVYLVDRERQELLSRVLRGDQHIEIRLPTGSGIAGYVASTGDILNIPDAYFDPRFNPEIDRKSGYRTRSILCMPMRNRDGVIVGVFQILNKRSGTFTKDDEEILGALSVHAAIALENARLYEQERVKIAMEKELLAAREVQMMLIPKRLPEKPGYDLAAVTIPAREVGGDLYDFIVRTETEIAFCLGDVSGKGLAASLLMANVQATLRDQAMTAESAAACIRRANALLFQSTGQEKFVTLFYAALDTATGSMTYCNAGHERPYLLGRNGSVKRLDTGGVVLGILEDFPFAQETVRLSPSDVVVVFSDGISEALNGADEQFGEERIEQALKGCGDRTAGEICNRLIAAVREHAAGAAQADDITLVVVKRVS
jgi:serine phosphatase RsbU (regulator of sigma subunit)/CRP-like cAMP-binding protein